MTDVSTNDYGDTGEVSFSPERSSYIFFPPAQSKAFTVCFQNLGKEAPGPAKMYVDGKGDVNSGRLILPVCPANFSFTPGNDQQTVTSISGLQYSHGGSFPLEEMQFESFLPALDPNVTLDASSLEGYISKDIITYGYLPPLAIVNRLKTAMKASQPLLFSIYPSTNNGSATAAVNAECLVDPTTVTISDFSWSFGTDVGGSSLDIAFSITLKKWRRQSLKFTANLPKPSIPTNTTTTTTTTTTRNTGTTIPSYPRQSGVSNPVLRAVATRVKNYLNGDAVTGNKTAVEISKRVLDIVSGISSTGGAEYIRLPGQFPKDHPYYLDIQNIYNKLKSGKLNIKKKELIVRQKNLLKGLINSLGVVYGRTLSGSPVQNGDTRGKSPAVPKKHAVKDGDTLTSVSIKYYGSTSKISEIKELNKDILVDRTFIPEDSDLPEVVPVYSTEPIKRADGGVPKQFSKVSPPVSTIPITGVESNNGKSKIIVPKSRPQQSLRLPRK